MYNQISSWLENSNNEVVNINIPSTSGSGNIQQPTNIPVHFNNCTKQNFNNYYNK